MSITFAEIAELVLGLPATQRLSLVNPLVDSLPDCPPAEIDAAWAEEIDRRVAEVEAGEAQLIPWSVVEAELDRLSTGRSAHSKSSDERS